MKTCPQCQIAFDASNSRKIYCDKKCKDRAKSAERRKLNANRPCAVDGCARSALDKRHCSMHYRRLRLTGSTGPANAVRGGRMGIKPCGIEGCDRKYYARDLCSMHYNRRQQTGDAGEASLRRQPAESGNVWRWQDPRSGYVYLTLPDDRKNRILEHRYVMEQHLGRPLWPDENVHHLNGQRGENSIENLELWSKSQPAGQRVADKVAWAREILARYEGLSPEVT